MAFNCGLGPYGARIALAKINLIQAITNDDEAMKLLNEKKGEDLLGLLTSTMLCYEAANNA